MVMDICWSVRENVKFNHVWWGRMPLSVGDAAVLWFQCASCVLPPCPTSWKGWRTQAGWSTSKLFWMPPSSSPRSVWGLIPAVCLTAALSIGLGVCLSVYVCVCVWKPVMRYGKTVRLQCFLCAILLDLNEGDKIIQKLQHDGNINIQ